MAGPQSRRIDEARLNSSTSINHQVGAFGQVEAMYWHEKGSLHEIGSSADLDNFFWGLLRGNLPAHQSDKSDKGCCKADMGWEVTGLANADFRTVKTVSLLEVPTGKIFLLVKVGYQSGNSFQSGSY